MRNSYPWLRDFDQGGSMLLAPLCNTRCAA